MFSLHTGLSQDTLTFLTGKVIIGEVQTSDSSVTTVVVKKRNKQIAKSYTNELLYSVHYQSGKKDTIYEPNSAYDLFLSKKDMGLFILGEQDAKKYYKTPLTSILGVAVSGTLGYVLHDGFYVAIIPLAYTAGAHFTPIKIKAPQTRSPEVLQSDAYQQGYYKQAATKKAFHALLSSLVGTIAGAAIGHSNN